MNELTQKIDLALAELMFLCLMINRHTEMAAMIKDHGHVSTIDMSIYESKPDVTKKERAPVVFSIRYDVKPQYYFFDDENRLAYIQSAVKFLRKTLEDKKIDYSATEAEYTKVVSHYNIIVDEL